VQNTPSDGFADRLKTAAAARQALLSRFKPAQARPALERIDRAGERAATLAQVRGERADAKAARQDAAAAALAADAQAIADTEAAALTAKRGERKERKALSAQDAKAKRDARYAARQARR
jgi:hypothetical protein